MIRRSWIATGVALLVSLLFIMPVFAGGWAVIALDELPSNVVAGKPLTIGFIVLQHGKTPMTDLEPTVTAQMSPTEKIMVDAKPEGEPGHYVATLTFPKEGEWEWSIQAFTMGQVMPTLTVSAPGPASVSQPAKTEAMPVTISPLLILRGLAFGIALVSLVVVFRSRSRLAVAVTGLCLLVGIGTFITGTTTLDVEAQGKSSAESPASQVELGRQLFIAKGCLTCHYNDKVGDRSEYWSLGITDLTKFTGNPEVLFLRLKDPASVKSDTQMPNLGLKEPEIEALIAFINAK
jgi:hypothetical protein